MLGPLDERPGQYHQSKKDSTAPFHTREGVFEKKWQKGKQREETLGRETFKGRGGGGPGVETVNLFTGGYRLAHSAGVKRDEKKKGCKEQEPSLQAVQVLKGQYRTGN